MRLFATFLLILSFCLQSFGQNSLKEIKSNFRNFSSKTTVVVLDPDGMTDAAIRDAVVKEWKISPYKFCTYSEYQEIKGDTSLFFLLLQKGRYKREAAEGIEYMTLVRGGGETKNTILKHPELISLPLRGIGDESGRFFSFIPAYINIIQSHIGKIADGILLAYAGELAYSNRSYDDLAEKRILFATQDIGFKTERDEIKWQFRGRADEVSEDEVIEALHSAKKDVVVSVVVAPAQLQKGGYCYKMLIGAGDRELYLFKKHKLSARNPKGFTREDIKRISVPFQLAK